MGWRASTEQALKHSTLNARLDDAKTPIPIRRERPLQRRTPGHPLDRRIAFLEPRRRAENPDARRGAGAHHGPHQRLHGIAVFHAPRFHRRGARHIEKEHRCRRNPRPRSEALALGRIHGGRASEVRALGMRALEPELEICGRLCSRVLENLRVLKSRALRGCPLLLTVKTLREFFPQAGRFFLVRGRSEFLGKSLDFGS